MNLMKTTVLNWEVGILDIHKRLFFVTFYEIEETTSLTCSQRYNFPEE